MRILICDDDLSITQSLSQIIKVYFKKKKVNVLDIVTFNDGDSLLSDKFQKDIVFLDIEMPGFDGIYVGNELKKQNESAIIFIVTSHLEYLDAAMRFHVFRYLSKPIDKQRLFQNLDDALELYYSINQKIAVETKYGVTSVLTCDIVYTATADLDSTQTLQFWIEHLPQATFFQSHRSYIVNMAMVTSFDHELIYLCDGQFIAYLTRRKFTEFKKAYLMFMESKR